MAFWDDVHKKWSSLPNCPRPLKNPDVMCKTYRRLKHRLDNNHKVKSRKGSLMLATPLGSLGECS